MEHIVRDRMGIYKGSHGAHIENIARTAFGAYNLIYQLGESLIADLASDSQTQEVTFAFSKGPVHYSDFCRDTSALVEQMGDRCDLLRASLWQRKLGLGAGKEFVSRLHIPGSEEAFREAVETIANFKRIGKETIVKQTR